MKKSKSEEYLEIEQMAARIAARLLKERDRDRLQSKKIAGLTNAAIRRIKNAGLAKAGPIAVVSIAGEKPRNLRFVGMVPPKDAIPGAFPELLDAPEILMIGKAKADKDPLISKSCSVIVKFAGKSRLQGSGFFNSFIQIKIEDSIFRVYRFQFDGDLGPIYSD